MSITYLLSCFLILFDVQILCQEIKKCDGDVAICVQNSTNLSQFYISSPTNGTKGKSMRRKHTSRSHRKRKNLNNRKNSQRKLHRHSTRVLYLKPAVILLPPFESTINPKNVSTLNPFIINILNSKSSTTKMNNKVTRKLTFISSFPEHEQSISNKDSTSTPSFINFKEDASNVKEPNTTSFTEPASTTVSYNRITSFSEVETTPVVDFIVSVQSTGLNNSDSISSPLPPFQFLLPPFLEERDNGLDSQLEKPKNHPLSEANSANHTETNIASHTHQSLETDSSIPLIDGEKVSKEDFNQTDFYNRFSPYDSKKQPSLDYFTNFTVLNDYDYMGRERGQERVSFNAFNNTLLAPEIASLGMKILTSRKGVEMMKELTTLIEPKPQKDHTQDRSQQLLETAESGDIRSHTYNQILSIEDVKGVPEDMYKALKTPHKPFEVCNQNQGYVADPSSGCQVFYICLGSGAGEPMMCPNGTLFNQEVLVCDWWYNVECSG